MISLSLTDDIIGSFVVKRTIYVMAPSFSGVYPAIPRKHLFGCS